MARRRAARGVKTVGLRPFVVDDVAAATRADVPTTTAPLPFDSLDGRERLEARIARWQRERERYRASQARGNSAPDASASPSGDVSAP